MTATLLYSWACKHKRAANMCCEIIDVQDGKLRRGACIVPNMVWLTRNGGSRWGAVTKRATTSR